MGWPDHQIEGQCCTVELRQPPLDGRNDIAMFAVSALAVAMGNAEPQVQEAADFVGSSNEEDGFAVAVERWILPRGAATAVAASGREGSP